MLRTDKFSFHYRRLCLKVQNLHFYLYDTYMTEGGGGEEGEERGGGSDSGSWDESG